jgi:hypothetical protein
MKAERSLFEDRQAIIARHKKDLVRLQAKYGKIFCVHSIADSVPGMYSHPYLFCH